MTEMTFFYAAGYLVEERRMASNLMFTHEDNSLNRGIIWKDLFGLEIGTSCLVGQQLVLL